MGYQHAFRGGSYSCSKAQALEKEYYGGNCFLTKVIINVFCCVRLVVKQIYVFIFCLNDLWEAETSA
jgi:hypothetical protein